MRFKIYTQHFQGEIRICIFRFDFHFTGIESKDTIHAGFPSWKLWLKKSVSAIVFPRKMVTPLGIRPDANVEPRKLILYRHGLA